MKLEMINNIEPVRYKDIKIGQAFKLFSKDPEYLNRAFLKTGIEDPSIKGEILHMSVDLETGKSIVIGNMWNCVPLTATVVIKVGDENEADS